MKIRYKIALQFSFIVAFILLIFSEIIYFRADTKREANFYDRLSKRAKTTTKFLVDVKEFSPEIVRLIDKNSLNRLNGEKVFVFNANNQLIYSNIENIPPAINLALLNKIRFQKEIKFVADEAENIGILFKGNYSQFIVIESAIDENGRNDLASLRRTLFLGFFISVVIVVFSGIFFAGQALQPIKIINHQIEQITANNLRKRVGEGENKDEIAELAHNFNLMLQRLELGFEQQRSFVSHASHELRTPLAAMKSEIQLGLEEKLEVEEHEQILQNLLKDTNRLISLSNGLLQLARTIENTNSFKIEPIRMEELILDVQADWQSVQKNNRISVDFVKIPTDENQTLVNGNAILLKNVFVNLIDNATKYSNSEPIAILIDFDEQYSIIKIKDKGIGIPANELANLFIPFYRAKNAFETQGFGIGLSVCQKIVELHEGKISVESELHKGSIFTIYLPHL